MGCEYDNLNNVIPSERSSRVYLGKRLILQNLLASLLTRYAHTQCCTKGVRYDLMSVKCRSFRYDS